MLSLNIEHYLSKLILLFWIQNNQKRSTFQNLKLAEVWFDGYSITIQSRLQSTQSTLQLSGTHDFNFETK